MLGISVYFQDLDLAYLKQASENGAVYVFTSLHIPEEDYSDLDKKLPLFLKTCTELGLKVVPDVSPVTFQKLNISPGNYHQLKEMGFEALRLDYGFDDFEVIKQLQKDFYLMLNASVIDASYLQKAKDAGIDFSRIAVTHNFYPLTETGLSKASLLIKNKMFQDFGLTIQAFVCGDEKRRFPLYEGLPTLEKHRCIPPLAAAVELLQACGVKDVLIGDSQARIETLQYIHDYMQEKILHIPCHLDKSYQCLYHQKLKIRKDQSDTVIRLLTARTKEVPVQAHIARKRGYIVMKNKLAGRYSGELQLIKKDLSYESRSNVIGFIHPEYLDLLEMIDPETIIVFETL